MINVLAGIVTYNPELKLLEKELYSLIQLKMPILIIDNCSRNVDNIDKMIAQIKENASITIIKNDSNKGVAFAHNQILSAAEQQKFEWAIIFDQDSGIPVNMLDGYEKHIQENTAIVCPFINYLTTDGLAINSIPDVESQSKLWAIASASMINVSAWKEINGFDEDMFIDLVDRDFCIRLREKGYEITQVNSVILDHHLGELTKKKLLGYVYYVENHSAFRKYYKTRNYIYLFHKKELSLIYAYGHVAQLLIETVLFEKDKVRKCKSIFKGICAGIKMYPRQ